MEAWRELMKLAKDENVKLSMPFGRGGRGPGGPGGPGGGPGGPPGGGLRTRPDCDDPGPLHSNWSVTQTVQNTVPWPEPYATMDNDNTYTQFI